MRKLGAKMVTTSLGKNQKLAKKQIHSEILGKTEEDANLFNTVDTCDETWLYQ
jgi:hypothetical protein